jgi:hypothetical protein
MATRAITNLNCEKGQQRCADSAALIAVAAIFANGRLPEGVGQRVRGGAATQSIITNVFPEFKEIPRR